MPRLNVRVRQSIDNTLGQFWLLPGLLVIVGILTAVGLVELDRSGVVPEWLIKSPWLYNGGGTGARTLLGAVVSSTIGVAGTVFSITIASLSLAAGQMGPRLLRNFMRDRGNQFTLGAFLGTFSYALMVLRSVRTQAEGEFVPHVSLTVSILLAFLCVGTLVFFVGHMAARINVDTVIEQVSRDLQSAIDRLTVTIAPSFAPSACTPTMIPLRDGRRGYLQHWDVEAIANWAATHAVFLKLLIRPGAYVFPNAVIGYASARADEASQIIVRHTALGADRVSNIDLEYSVRQLVEVAVRALSPGINDPHTAISVINQLGAALCKIAHRYLPNGVYSPQGRTALEVNCVTYDGLTDAMFHMIRQNAAGSAAVLIRMVEVLTTVTDSEPDPLRRCALMHHAQLILADGQRDIPNSYDTQDLQVRYATLEVLLAVPPPPA